MTPLSTRQAAAQLTGGQGDETGWRINDQTAGAWGFRDPSLALFLIERHCSREVLMRVMGASFADTLVSDFYAAYHGRDCPKQRPNCGTNCPARRCGRSSNRSSPWFRDAIQLAKDRDQQTRKAFDGAHRAILNRFDDLLLQSRSRHPECLRI